MDSYRELKFSGMDDDNLTKVSGKNILYFSDGTLDLDEFDGSPNVTNEIPVDPQKLSWAPWMWYYTMFAGGKALEVCDYLGEFFATFFGITTPKYQYEISEFHRIQKEELERSKDRDLERNTSCPNVGELNQNGSSRPWRTAVEDIQLQYTNTVQPEKC